MLEVAAVCRAAVCLVLRLQPNELLVFWVPNSLRPLFRYEEIFTKSRGLELGSLVPVEQFRAKKTEELVVQAEASRRP